MYNQLILNDTDYIRYYCIKKRRFLNEKEACDLNKITNANTYKNYVQNGLNPLRSPGNYNYFNQIAAIPPRTQASLEKTYYKVTSNLKTFKINYSYTINDLNDYVEKLISKYSKKTFAVELSGGLDSSLIIEFLLKFNIKPVLIGYASNEFEFRTERKIQEYYTNKGCITEFLEMEDYPLFSDLKKIPKHPIPSSPALWFRRHQIVAELAKKHGADIVFSGEAGDQLFGFRNDIKDGDDVPLQFGYWCLSQTWINQYVYNKLHMSYVSALALGRLPSILLSLRKNQDDDPMKLWARNYFKHCLPSNLSEYAYVAFFDRWFINGLKHAVDDIGELCRYAYRLTAITDLEPTLINVKTYQYGQMSELEKKQYLLNITYAAWLYSNRH